MLYYNIAKYKWFVKKPTIQSTKHQRTALSSSEGIGECMGVWVALPTYHPENQRQTAQDNTQFTDAPIESINEWADARIKATRGRPGE